MTLKPMSIEQYGAFVEVSAESHAADNVASGRWRQEEAAQLSRSELNKLLPQGIATPEHFFYELTAEGSCSVIGFVWLSSMPRGASKVAFLFQLFVYPEHRRRGPRSSSIAAG